MNTAALPQSIEGVQIIGIDCAAQPKGFGLARARVRDGSLEILDATKGKGADNRFDDLATKVQDWIDGDDLPDSPSRTLLALDAPLGWPLHLTHALHDHRAGAPLEHPDEKASADPNPGNHLFRRHTDRFLAGKFPGAPLDIGADRIARVARSALDLLGRLGTTDDRHSPVPLLWDPGRLERLGAIEVYPRLTLRALTGGPRKPELHYKGSKQARNRRTIVQILHRTLNRNLDTLLVKRAKTGADDYDHDLIDAVLCALEGLHFLIGKGVGPQHPEAPRWLAEETRGATIASLADIQTTEGWIWFHEDLLKGQS